MEAIYLLRSNRLQGIKRLDLAAGLMDFPIEIFDLADALKRSHLDPRSSQNWVVAIDLYYPMWKCNLGIADLLCKFQDRPLE